MWKINLDGSAYDMKTHMRLLINDKTNAVLLYKPFHGAEFLKATRSYDDAAAYIRSLVDKFNAENLK